MKRIWLLLLILTAGLAGCSKDDPIDPSDPTVTPPTADITADFDPLFAQELQKRGYIADAKNITLEEVKGFTELDVDGSSNSKKLTSLRGIEYFESLTRLDCHGNQLTALDVSKNTALTELRCTGNQLTALDVSKNTALTRMLCSGNQLTTLDVSNDTALTSLSCAFNGLTTLDVSINTALTHLWCGHNQLSALDISNNTALIEFYCYGNPGDGTVFPVTAWFDNNAIPSDFPTGYWYCSGTKITIDYRNAE